MMKLLVTLLALSLTAAAARAQTQVDSQAVRSRVEALQAAWNARDASAVAALYSTDADQIILSGSVLRGRQAIQQSNRDGFSSTAEGQKIALAVTSLRLITPDVAIINTTANFTGGRDAQGKELPGQSDRGTWVLIRQEGQWFIAALRVLPAEKAPSR